MTPETKHLLKIPLYEYSQAGTEQRIQAVEHVKRNLIAYPNRNDKYTKASEIFLYILKRNPDY